jgi:cysteinyl-tRNA synthetase
VQPFARAWMQVGVVGLDGKKMAKSTGNLVLVDDLLRDHPAGAIRLMLLNRRWSEPWDFSTALLDEAAATLDSLTAAIDRRGGQSAVDAVRSALADDLDVPAALALALDAGGTAAELVLRLVAPQDH